MKTMLGVLLFAMLLPVYGGEVVTVRARPDASQSGLLIQADHARAVVLLFPGGAGVIKLQPDGSFSRHGGNFLVRSRQYFIANHLHVVVMDAPSDRQSSRGMQYGFRATAEHAQDIAAMVTAMQQRFNLPVWLIGTSRGTESVANALEMLNTQIDGAVLTASITEMNNKGNSVLDFNFDNVSVPVMVVHHANDECWVTLPAGAERIGKALPATIRKQVRLFSGGDEAVAKVCNGKSAHGFYGIEREVVDAIAAFILAEQ